MSEYTPGPWDFIDDGNNFYNIIAGCYDAEIAKAIIDEADARLIAKAPEMFEILKEIRRAIRSEALFVIESQDAVEALRSTLKLLEEIEGGGQFEIQ